jgi:signal transduction histidine kinase
MKSQNEYRFMTVDDEEGQPFGLFAFCNDKSYIILSQEQQQQSEKKLNEVTEKEKEYIEAIDDFIGKGRSRVVTYSPTSHMLTIYNASEKVQLALTPTRLITLIDDRMTYKVMRILSNMDAGSQATIDTDIRTVLRIKGGLILHIHILLQPQYDEQNNVKEYLGMLQDISQQKAYEAQLANIKAQTQEIEDTKATFIRNMMQEIRTPLSKVIDNATQLTPVPDSTNTEHEQNLSQAIISNADHLTHIIDNILFLSRLEAHIIEIRKQPTDFAAIFNTYCEKGWEKYKQETVRYIVENPYEQLEVNIDADHLGHVISQLTQNAAQHTHSGAIRVRYDYIGRRLMISVDDTGDGIPSIELARLNGQLGKSSHTSNGLGLPICKELLIQMGGNLEMNSEEKLGTTVWITLPCAATVVKRKKLL